MSALVVKTVKLPKRMATALARSARSRGCSESELIREGIETVLADEGGLDMQAIIGPDLGVVRGPKDLSAGRRHLNGYGRSRNR